MPFLAILLCTHTFLVGHYPNWVNPNVASRLYLALAIVDEGRFAVDGPVKRYGLFRDAAHYQGHFYSDKPPGSAWLAVPVVWVLRQAFVPIEDHQNMLMLVTWLGVALPTALFWWWTEPYYRTFTGDERLSQAVVLAGALGTNFVVYATHWFSHVPAGILLFLAYRSARRGAAESRRGLGLLWSSATGVCLAYAFITDFLVCFAIPIVSLVLVAGPGRRFEKGIALVLAALPVATAWLAYNQACFGHPLRFGSHVLYDVRYADLYSKGLWGMHPPSLDGLVGMWFSVDRGMLFLSPVLSLAIVGWFRLLLDRRRRGDGIWSLAVTFALALFTSTTVEWKGGWSAGTRYLVPAIPFLLVAVAASLRPGTLSPMIAVLFLGFSAVSLVNLAVTATTFPHFPPELRNPVHSLAWPLFRDGFVACDVGWSALGPSSRWVWCALVAWAGCRITLGTIRGLNVRPTATLGAALLLAVGMLAWESRVEERASERWAHSYLMTRILDHLGHDPTFAPTLLPCEVPAPPPKPNNRELGL